VTMIFVDVKFESPRHTKSKLVLIKHHNNKKCTEECSA